MKRRTCIAVVAVSAAAWQSSLARQPVEFSVSVDAKAHWTNTGIEVRTGETLNIKWAGGVWRGDVGETNCPEHGPAGPTCDEFLAPPEYPLPGAMEDSLVGRIGDGPVFFVGEHIRKAVKQGGSLHLRINDIDSGLDNNTGTVRMNISVTLSR